MLKTGLKTGVLLTNRIFTARNSNIQCFDPLESQILELVFVRKTNQKHQTESKHQSKTKKIQNTFEKQKQIKNHQKTKPKKRFTTTIKATTNRVVLLFHHSFRVTVRRPPSLASSFLWWCRLPRPPWGGAAFSPSRVGGVAFLRLLGVVLSFSFVIIGDES